jgi:archaemetzincin
MENIWLFWTSGVNSGVLEYLQEHLAETFSRSVKRGKVFELLPEEFHTDRGQYYSTSILGRLRQMKPERDLLLAISEADLFAADLNFVFGEADVYGRCAIISLARLRLAYAGQPLTRELFLRRTLTEAVHEIGHLLRLGHCPNPTCVMHFSNTLYDTDYKTSQFCSRCQKYSLG